MINDDMVRVHDTICTAVRTYVRILTRTESKCVCVCVGGGCSHIHGYQHAEKSPKSAKMLPIDIHSHNELLKLNRNLFGGILNIQNE